MRQAIMTIAALLLAVAILISGNGLQNTLLAIRGNLEGFPIVFIGMLTSGYFVGYIAGCRIAPIMVARVGHIRTFTALASIASASALAHALVVDIPAWLVLRIITGFALAGLQMIIESWINESATNKNRGQVLAIYRIVDLGGTTIGQVLLTLADPTGFTLFAITSILISLSLVPVALTTAVTPKPITQAKLDLRKLLRVSPLAVAGALAVGAANSVFWAVGPVWVQRVGFDVAIVATFVSAVVIAGALSQWPLGYASDKFDRRKVIVIVSTLTAASAAFLATLGPTSFYFLIGGAIGFGLVAMPMFGLCTAHANDRTEPGEYISTSAGLLLIYGIGAVIGPVAGPLLMEIGGPQMLFVYIAVCYSILSLFGIYRMTRRAAVAATEKAPFLHVPRTSPVAFEMDPRLPPDAREGAAPKTP